MARRAQPSPGRVVLASAKPLDLDDRLTRDAWRKRREGWQAEGWRYYDEIGEIKFAELVTANWMRKLRLFAAVQPEADQPPIPVDDPEAGISPGLVAEAIDAVDRLKGDEGSHGELVARFAVNMDIAGECVLVGTTSVDGVETFTVRSTQELTVDSRDRWVIRSGPDDKNGAPLPPESTAVRMWRAHPEWSERPDAPMRGVLDRCDELLILSRQIRAEARSRLTRGVLLVPDEVSFGAADPTTSGDQGATAGFDQFQADLIEAFSTGIREEGSASAVVPFLVRCPSAFIDKWVHLDFARSGEDRTATQRDELIHRIAAGLDMPAEVLLGLGQGHVNHWTADVIDQQTFDAHLQPRAELLCSSLTKGYLRPALSPEALAAGIMVWYDASHLIGHPDAEQRALDAHDRMLISDEAARRALGYGDDAAPEPAELEQRIRRKATVRIGDSPPPEMMAAAVPIRARSRVIVAAGSRRDTQVARLGARLGGIDRDLFSRLHVAADSALTRALEVTGAALRRKVARDKSLTAMLADVPNAEVAARLGDKVAGPLLAAGDQTIAALGPLRDRYDAWVTRAQAQARAAALAVDEHDELDEGMLAATQDRDRAAGWLVLSGALAALVGSRLYDPHPAAPPRGEFDGQSGVPAGVIREALGRAGGGDGQVGPGGAVLTTNGGVSTGVATGPTILDSLASVSITTDGWVWAVGAPERPFEPHQALDGAQFSSWDDELLANDDVWPDTAFFMPGDHAGCQCMAFPQLSAVVSVLEAA